jgi:membrane protein DedA with SNARE-associated domain
MVNDWFDFAGLFIAVMLGSFAGESLGFYIGRVFGPRIRSSKLGSRIPEKNQYLAFRLRTRHNTSLLPRK